MVDLTRDGASRGRGLEAIDLTGNENSWAQISKLTFQVRVLKLWQNYFQALLISKENSNGEQN